MATSATTPAPGAPPVPAAVPVGEPARTGAGRGRAVDVRAALRTDLGAALLVVGGWLLAVTLLRRWDYWHPMWFESYWIAGVWLGVPIALRRLAPGWAYAATTIGYPVLYTWWVPPGLQSAFHLAPMLLAAFVVTRRRRLSVWYVAPASAACALWLVWGSWRPLLMWARGHVDSPGGSVNDLLLVVTLVAGAAVLGAVLGRLDETLASLAERNRQLEELQEVRTREAVQSERVRIARDLHDVVAHHVSAIVVRAQAVERVGGDDVEVYRDAVRWIGPAGREALDAMRSVVRVLRDDRAPMAPTSTLADLAAVVARMREAGLAVDADLPPALPPCAPAVGLAVVRVAQEALTNVASHSGAQRATVALAQVGPRLVLEVTDPGPRRPPEDTRGAGNGLVHMHERAAACGGTVLVGPAGDGWRVRLEVPTDA